MTYTFRRYRSYQEYLDDDELHHENNYRLLDTGEAIEVASEDENNLWLANILMISILQVEGLMLAELIRAGTKEIQVKPMGDRCMNRKPDLLVMRPEHRLDRQAIKLGSSAPAFVAEVVSPGNETSDNYLRDYVWERQQYQEWKIPEYWILDTHRQQITVLTLVNGEYQEALYKGERKITSTIYPALDLTAQKLLSGDV